jgi:nicotinamide-nucleotide amidase
MDWKGVFVLQAKEERLSALAGQTVAALKEKNLLLATAESCTGGMIAAAITSVSGASGVFHCGMVTYSNDMKEKMLGVSRETLERFSAVSAETAAEMAAGARFFSGADIGVAVTGNAGPEPSEGKPVGEVYAAVDSPLHREVRRLCCPDSIEGNVRETIRRMTAELALQMVLETIARNEQTV